MSAYASNRGVSLLRALSRDMSRLSRFAYLGLNNPHPLARCIGGDDTLGFELFPGAVERFPFGIPLLSRVIAVAVGKPLRVYAR